MMSATGQESTGDDYERYYRHDNYAFNSHIIARDESLTTTRKRHNDFDANSVVDKLVMMQKLKRYLLLSQINLFGWLIFSSIIVSSVVLKNGGVSNFGNHYSTVIFYTIAFLADITYIYLAAGSLIRLSGRFKYLARYLYTLCVILLLVYLTTFPRRFGAVFSDIHDNISEGLFVYELFLGLWLLIKRPTLETILYLLIMVGGSLVGLLSALHVLHLMFVGQMVGSFGFALLFVLVLPKVVASDLTKHRAKK